MIIYPEEIMTAKIKTLEAEVEFWKEIVRNENAMTEKYKQACEAFPDNYFISGEGGEKDANGLPERLHVCPAYGLDWFQVYERTDNTWGPEY
jgi:hypothetical protein